MARFLICMFTAASSLLAASTHYMLPDHSYDAERALALAVTSAQKRITIMTENLESRTLKNALKKAAGKGVDVTLICSGKNPNDATYLAQFQNVSLYTVSGLQTDAFAGKLRYTSLLADDNHLCVSSIPFVTLQMRHDIGFLSCSSDPELIAGHAKQIQHIRARSTPYLHD